MFSLLLALIYISFISLGLPDPLLGAAWPVIRADIGAPMSYAGIISMVISCCTIISSLASDRMSRRFGTGALTAASVAMTAIALFGFSLSPSFAVLCLWAVPYGLGAGGVDSALNNYVALHYASRHMSWLHCFWGIGTSVSPYIMGFCLALNLGWQSGYRAVGIIQLALTAVLFISLPLWRRPDSPDTEAPEQREPRGVLGVLRLRGVLLMLVAFLCYGALESTTGLWATSYLVEHRGIGETTAARFASLFYLGITLGRALCGFISDKLGDRRLIRIGTLTVIGGIAMLLLPISEDLTALVGLVVIGLGCAPIYPSIIHATPDNFGRENSQAVIGVQTASAYAGSTFMPLLFGAAASAAGTVIYPIYLLALALLLLVMTEALNRCVKR